jgi:hypothetical protein
MTENADRGRKRKRIRSRFDDTIFVDIPVNYDATFVTAADQYQEGHFYFNNSSTSSRKTRVQRVQSTTTGDYIEVERIQSFFTKTAAEQYQETEWVMANADPPPVQPDGTDTPSHEKKHVVRFFKDNDDSSQNWVDVELIDQLNATLPQDQYQEYHLFMKNADLGDVVNDPSVPYDVTKGFCDPSLDLAPTEEGFDPPYRIDPLQNIVNFSSPTLAVVTWYYKRDNDLDNPPDIAPVRPVEFRDLALSLVPGSPTKPANFSVTGAPTVPSIAAGVPFINWINSPAGGPPDAVFTGTTSVSGTVAIGTGPSPGVTTGTTSITASISGISGSMSSTPWVLHGLSITFAQCQGPVTSPPATVFGIIYPDWIIAEAVFKPS